MYRGPFVEWRKPQQLSNDLILGDDELLDACANSIITRCQGEASNIRLLLALSSLDGCTGVFTEVSLKSSQWLKIIAESQTVLAIAHEIPGFPSVASKYGWEYWDTDSKPKEPSLVTLVVHRASLDEFSDTRNYTQNLQSISSYLRRAFASIKRGSHILMQFDGPPFHPLLLFILDKTSHMFESCNIFPSTENVGCYVLLYSFKPELTAKQEFFITHFLTCPSRDKELDSAVSWYPDDPVAVFSRFNDLSRCLKVISSRFKEPRSLTKPGSAPPSRPAPSAAVGSAGTARPAPSPAVGSAPPSRPAPSAAVGSAGTARPAPSPAVGSAPPSRPAPSAAVGSAGTARPAPSPAVGSAPPSRPAPSAAVRSAGTARPAPSAAVGRAGTARPAPSAAVRSAGTARPAPTATWEPSPLREFSHSSTQPKIIKPNTDDHLHAYPPSRVVLLARDKILSN